MEDQNYLGIYIGKNTATVVCLGPQGQDRNVLGCFSVSVEQQQEQSCQALARLVAQGCAERQLTFSEVAVALDCAMFMQHNVHSEFTDARQIGQTIRFDTEEALSTDIADLAIAFRISSSGETGSDLTVFTAQRKALSDVLLALQSNNIDPVTVEPDVNSLTRFISQNLTSSQDSCALFVMLSRHRGYFVAFTGIDDIATVRTFLVDPNQDRVALLARELPVTVALLATEKPIGCVHFFDSADLVGPQQLSQQLGIEVSGLDLGADIHTDAGILADCAGPVDFAIAHGAALAHVEKVHSVNFRDDFMPYMGKKLRLEKTLKFLSVAVTVFVIALGMYFTSQLLRTSKYRGLLRDKFEPDYRTVVLGEKKLPSKFREAVRKLGGEFRRTQSVKSGQLSAAGQESILAKLTLVFEAVNKCAAKTNLNIKSVSVAAKNMTIEGDTSSRGNRNTLRFFDAIKKSGMEILKQKVDSKGGRDSFIITVAPKRRG